MSGYSSADIAAFAEVVRRMNLIRHESDAPKETTVRGMHPYGHVIDPLTPKEATMANIAQPAWTDRIGLWSDTPPTPIDPAEIKVGMRVRRVLRHKDGDRTTTTESTVTAVHPRLITLSECVYHLAEGGDWFLIEDAPDPDAHWIRAIAEATPETAPTVYAAIKGEQA